MTFYFVVLFVLYLDTICWLWERKLVLFVKISLSLVARFPRNIKNVISVVLHRKQEWYEFVFARLCISIKGWKELTDRIIVRIFDVVCSCMYSIIPSVL